MLSEKSLGFGDTDWHFHCSTIPLFLNFILACDLDHMTSPFKSSALFKVNMGMDETTHIKCLAS